MTPRWARAHRQQRVDGRKHRQYLARLARERVTAGYHLNPAKVGELSNGALLLRLAALVAR